ncbi:WhiB family transcriptional regulator [Streptomyces sp. NBC_00439]|uniref:WhiB family transcriptional regulator n=1 Tax=Streptomyces sp. NBC_00439 TaxID=2903650 RepID=UPI00224E0648|nr:WhiB family transcriptional regulator [Streptomyces sp. NBC_00439]MCX5106977.1 WhiB family transcriptional regulator [Streptomyces sp. NBC_00439]
MKLSTNAAALVWSPGPSETPACKGLDLDLFFPEASNASALRPSPEEREALAVCAGCPAREWCLAREMEECTVTSRIVGVRGGMRQADRRALHVELYGVRAPYRAGAGDE